MTQSFPLLAFTPLVRSLSDLWGRHFGALEKRNWSIGGARPNPETRDLNQSQYMLGRLTTALLRRRIRRQWQHDLRALDDRQLSDIGISRDDAERTIDRIRFWI